MSTSKLRTEIMKNCPVEFQAELKDWIDEVEGRLAEAYWYLDEDEIGEEYAQEAKKHLEQILEELY
jgi:hypothetical protein